MNVQEESGTGLGVMLVLVVAVLAKSDSLMFKFL